MDKRLIPVCKKEDDIPEELSSNQGRVVNHNLDYNLIKTIESYFSQQNQNKKYESSNIDNLDDLYYFLITCTVDMSKFNK